MFNSIVVDSSGSKTDLCILGEKYGTDKSPYNTTSESRHRHPYTAVYDALFGTIRYKNIYFGEMGILNNRSMHCWRDYFPSARLYGWDFDTSLLNQARSHNLHNTSYDYMNIFDANSIETSLAKTGFLFDVLIEDTTHQPDDQLRVASVVHKYLRAGGIFVIEDVYRDIPEEFYIKSLANIAPYYSNITFITTEHVFRDSTGWNNDKLIVFHRNNLS